MALAHLYITCPRTMVYSIFCLPGDLSWTSPSVLLKPTLHSYAQMSKNQRFPIIILQSKPSRLCGAKQLKNQMQYIYNMELKILCEK